ncbi:Glutathione S-transferase [Actinidia chinensis var. chinensis]|uniref:Glutathione S-transferase n=1 Tax=Actinidia chinensis var. chinensis TaxID=1590841 RepID=A0A2R6P7R3_ACTCC|nr:Glutathione S-transferase [Actinidia chinensis var. chinensis]
MMSASCANLLSISPLHCTTIDTQIQITIAPKLPTVSSQFQQLRFLRPLRLFSKNTRAAPTPCLATNVGAEELLPPVLDSNSDPPPLFDGTTRLYTSYICPYAQRVWIARNYKGLQEKIELVPIDLENRPAWYKEKVYPPNKVTFLNTIVNCLGIQSDVENSHLCISKCYCFFMPSTKRCLHWSTIMKSEESLDLIKYIDSCFEGPALYPDDPTKIEFAEELLSYTNTFNLAVLTSLKDNSENKISTAFDYLETALVRFKDGPFFLGQFSLVDVAYAPFVERFHPLLLDVKKYDVTSGRPMLTSWIQEMNKIEAYKQTKRDPQELIAVLKKRFSIN